MPYNRRRPVSEARKQRIDQQQAILQRLREGGALSGAQPATPFRVVGRPQNIPDLYAAQKYYIGYFQPLQITSWFAHFVSMPRNLELIPLLYNRIESGSSSDKNTTNKSTFYMSTILYTTLFVLQ